jgi:monofunctional glycosyltransferase
VSGKLRKSLRRIVLGILLFVVALYAGCVLLVVGLKWIDPPTTAVQMERRIGALVHHRPYRKRYQFVPLENISPNLQHAVVSAEDGRFRQHHGFDWVEMQKVLEQDLKRHKLGRGGSTITQQLVKNLFLSTERSLIRKVAEFILVPAVEKLLTKDRILELYLNVIEWGPGIYGAQAASEVYYHKPAMEMSREEAAGLAAIIPAPLRRKPDGMNEYSDEILHRMKQTGW